MIITPQEMAEYVAKTLDDVVKDLPEERREAVKAKILDAFSESMFGEHTVEEKPRGE